jgi:hypothetical protein
VFERLQAGFSKVIGFIYEKIIIWASLSIKWMILCQHLFLFIVGGIATCFDTFLGSSSGVHEYDLVSELLH